MPGENHYSPDDLVNDVNNAIHSMDYKRLNDEIRNSMQTVFDELNINVNISDHLKGAGSARGGTQTTSSRLHPGSAGSAAAVHAPIAVRNPRGSLMAMVLMALGATFTTIFIIAMFVVVMLGIFIESFHALPIILILCPFLAASIVVANIGSRKNKRVKRFKNYLKIIGDRSYVSVKELAEATGKSEKFVADDLRVMISKGFFTNAHLDSQGTTLMLDAESYKQYMDSLTGYKERKKREQEEADAVKANPQLREALNEGREYMKQIRAAREKVSSAEFAAKIDRLEQLIIQIYAIVRKQPEKLSKLRRFMMYYMPTTVKLLNAYTELAAQPEKTENIKESCRQIEESIDTINLAYENLLDSMYESSTIDISSDISVLQNMFAQDGLSEDPFDTSAGHETSSASQSAAAGASGSAAQAMEDKHT